MTRRNALAQWLCFDAADMGDYLYHPGQTSQPIWAIDQRYFTVGTAADAARVGAYLGLTGSAVHTVNAKWSIYQF